MFSTSLILAEYFSRRTGEEYGLELSTKIALFLKMRRNNHRIIGATDFLETYGNGDKNIDHSKIC
jgi:hypothetical protein